MIVYDYFEVKKDLPEQVGTGTNRKLVIKTVVISLLVISSATSLVFVGYWYGVKTLSQTSTKSSTSPTPQVTQPAGSITEVPYGDEDLDKDEAYQKAMKEGKDPGPYGWKTFTTKDGKYTLKYPPDWVLQDKSADVDLYNDGKKQFQQNITISYQNHSFSSINPLAWGPGVCLYPDSPEFDGPAGDVIEKYVTIQGANTLYRRPEVSTYDLPQSKLKWFICQKEETGNQYTSVSGFGSTWYETPKQYDLTTLLLMDQIMASFTKNK